MSGSGAAKDHKADHDPKASAFDMVVVVVDGDHFRGRGLGVSCCTQRRLKKETKMNDIAKCLVKNDSDEYDNPAGGEVSGVGLSIVWQNGPLGRENQKEPNGAFVETVLSAALQRIQYYQDSKFKCRENAIAITKIEEALLWLDKRTRDREARNVEGTHAI